MAQKQYHMVLHTNITIIMLCYEAIIFKLFSPNQLFDILKVPIMFQKKESSDCYSLESIFISVTLFQKIP